MPLSLKLYLANARRAGARALRAQNRKATPQTKRLARPAGQLVWLHVSNPEEIAPVRELIRNLATEHDEVSFLVTTSESVQVDVCFQSICDQPCLHLPAPPDTPQQVTDFLGHWLPTVAVWAGSVLRPALLVGAHSRNIPLFLVDVRSPASVDNRTRSNKGIIESVLALFTHILIGKGTVARKLIQQGADADCIEVCGLLEEGATTLICDDRDRDEMVATLAARPVWLAANTDEAEEPLVASAHRAASRLSHRLLLIIAPHDPARGKTLARALKDDGWVIARRSKGQGLDEHVQIFIADSKDEMGLWLRLAPVCFMGNSLTKGATGCSPLEASALGSAILHGPYVGDYNTGYARLDAAGAAREVKNEAQLATGVQDLLAPDKAAAMAHAGWEISTSGAEAADRTVALIQTALDQAEFA